MVGGLVGPSVALRVMTKLASRHDTGKKWMLIVEVVHKGTGSRKEGARVCAPRGGLSEPIVSESGDSSDPMTRRAAKANVKYEPPGFEPSDTTEPT